MTVLFSSEDYTETLTLPDFQFGDSHDWSRGQAVDETTDGYMAVTDREYTNHTYTGVIQEMTHDQMLAAKRFFNEILQWSKYRFWIRFTNIRDTEEWNRMTYPIVCSATIGGVAIKCSDQYGGVDICCDNNLPIDHYVIGPCRLRAGGYRVTSRFEGIYELSLTLVVEHEE